MPTINHTPTPWKQGEWIRSKGHAVYKLIFGKGRHLAYVGVYGRNPDGTTGGYVAKSGDHTPTATESQSQADVDFLIRAVNAHDGFVKLLEDARERLTYQCDAGTKQLLADRIVAALKASGDWVK